ncbi:bile acid:sodium symporter family protein [Halobacillus halophilus]|uniref:bile acid:sodium symporter family protein n=1 Tax=Halobacillus halophilus TaxID=1570 RepID=UPI001CD5245F|nr:bile acid:sodium symporter family protein [Halobacillus halophilus]MCA1010055.1 bile acid:sodium symporter family protein [Halobacillus halophilus]
MIRTFNQFLQKIMPYLTPSAVIIGVVFSDWFDSLVFLVPWIFAVMTFAGSLGSNFSDLKKVLRHPVAMIACIMVLHIVMPLIALGVGTLIFGSGAHTTIGLVLSFVIPTGITTLIWVSINKGNVVLTLSIILVDTLIAPLAVPFVMQMLVGNAVEMNVQEIMNGLLWMIVIPSLVGMLINQFAEKEFTEKLESNLSPATKLGIGAVVTINSSAVAPYFKNINGKLILIGVVVCMLAIFAYFIGFLTGKLLKIGRPSIISLTFNSGMRNISGGAVIAITYFPPPVAVPVIVGMLFQQVLASFTGKIFASHGAEEQSVSH